jgi:murein DD-endopeptidase MepM/ murein hydrolase activator NlpD
MSPWLVADWWAEKTVTPIGGRPPAPKPRADRPRDDIDKVRLKGKRLSVDVRESLLDIEIEQTIEGATILTLVIHDPQRKLQRSGIFEEGVRLELDGQDFVCVGGDKDAPTNRVEFEPLNVWRLRQPKGFRRGFRDKITRAEFGLQLIRELKAPPIPVSIPELRKKQPIANVKQRKSEKDRKKDRARGIDPDADLTVKGVKASRYQIRCAEISLDVADSRDAPELAQVSLILAEINETTIRHDAFLEVGSGDADSVGILQVRAGIHGLALAQSIERSVDKFLVGGYTGFGGGAIAMAKTGKYTAEQIASYTNYGAPPSFHDYPDSYVREAARFVAAYNGQSGNSLSITEPRRYKFTRKRNENTWDCLQRIFGEVQWRVFETGGTIHIVAENDLIRSKPRYRIRETTPGIERLNYSWRRGRKTQEITVATRLNRWQAPPGTVVVVEGEGEGIDGRYLVSTIRGSAFSAEREVVLKRPMREKREPAPETVTRTIGGGEKNGDWTTTGKMAAPINGTVTSPFGQRWGRLHDGIDYGAPEGTPVRAALAGTVTQAGPNGGYGNYVEIRHGAGLSSFYGHLSAIGVKVGEKVGRGDVIAKSGNTGSSTGPHLHFGVHRNGAPVNPAEFL